MINILEEKIIRLAILEDQMLGDVTTEALIPAECVGEGVLVAKEDFIIAGIETFFNVFKILETEHVMDITFSKQNGSSVKEGEEFARVAGNAHTLLMGERIGLNFLQHLSGVATTTARFVEVASRYGVTVLDTRKTTPGLRYLEKKAVLAAGGKNHRFSLSHAVLIKDNHIAISGGVAQSLDAVRDKAPYLGKIEIEVKNIEELGVALKRGADVVMLDNMSNDEIKQAVAMAGKSVQLEISGGVTLENLAEKAQTGVKFISVGALTHSAPAVDISMNIELSA